MKGSDKEVNEIIKIPDIAKVIGCSDNQARYNIKHKVWDFGKTAKRGCKTFCFATISEIADYLGITREEVERRLRSDEGT